jgi:hypothetical protein
MLTMSGPIQLSGNHTLLQPACPSCGRVLCLTRTIPGINGLSELRTYGCRECGVWVTEAAHDPTGLVRVKKAVA